MPKYQSKILVKNFMKILSNYLNEFSLNDFSPLPTVHIIFWIRSYMKLGWVRSSALPLSYNRKHKVSTFHVGKLVQHVYVIDKIQEVQMRLSAGHDGNESRSAHLIMPLISRISKLIINKIQFLHETIQKTACAVCVYIKYICEMSMRRSE